MIKPTFQDVDRRVAYVPNEYIKLANGSNLDEYSIKKERGTIVVWNESTVTVKFDGVYKMKECKPKNLFWEDGKQDFDELRSLND